MVALNNISGFDWDAGNERKNTDKHGVSKPESESIFFNDPLLLLDDEKHSASEPRYHALGKTNDGRRLHITFTVRGDKIRVISAHDMHHMERRFYEDENTDLQI